MIERAFDLINSDRGHSHSLDELRKFAGVTLRTRGRLAEQLRDHPDVMEVGNARFQYFANRPISRRL
jgi:hypothetical protein